jgi:hypothetical protein
MNTRLFSLTGLWLSHFLSQESKRYIHAGLSIDSILLCLDTMDSQRLFIYLRNLKSYPNYAGFLCIPPYFIMLNLFLVLYQYHLNFKINRLHL